jgi:hypothetical protein
MTKELEEYYNSLFELFSTKGWEYLVEDWEQAISHLDQVSTIRDSRDLDFRQGSLAILTGLISLKTTCESAHKQIQEEGENL